ncbi:MAG: septum formation initiator family protein [Deltaproteobacteria bacterium]|jgi:cell division protein FtsB|nr:septum formation initiator family protein [Deltaproteobacteria bacterium]MBW2479398.1 septum formation initiator family protein [Deltaproteobacteria bacterium]
MTKNQNILLWVSALLLLALFFFIIVSEHGLADLRFLKREHDRLVDQNRQLTRENQAISIEIDRLKHDPVYIESIARQELGMIGKDEIILKPQNPPE